MPTYSGSGTEPLGSNPSPKTSAAATGDHSAGKEAGGTANLRAYEAALTSTQLKKHSAGGQVRHPEGVKSFKDGV